MKRGEVYSVLVPSENKDITIKAVVIMVCGNKVLFYGQNKLFTMLYSTQEYIINYDEDNNFFIASEGLLFDETIIDDVVINEIDNILKIC